MRTWSSGTRGLKRGRPIVGNGRVRRNPGLPRQGLLRPHRVRVDRNAVTYLVDANVVSGRALPIKDSL